MNTGGSRNYFVVCFKYVSQLAVVNCAKQCNSRKSISYEIDIFTHFHKNVPLNDHNKLVCFYLIRTITEKNLFYLYSRAKNKYSADTNLTNYLLFLLLFFSIRFKNGQPYPWSSSLILYPQAENQTIYTRHATINDNGNYTCVIHGATHKMEHVIEFTVQGN